MRQGAPRWFLLVHCACLTLGALATSYPRTALAVEASNPAGALPRSSSAPPSSPVVDGITETGYRVRLSLGEPTVTRGEIFGIDLAEISFPGSFPEPARGGPTLPSRTVFLRIPAGVRASVTASPGPFRSLGAIRPSPFAGLLTEAAVRDHFGAAAIEAALQGPGYGSRSRVEARRVEVRDMAAREERLLAVTIRPLTWDPETGEARFSDTMTLDVHWEGSIAPIAPLSASAVATTPENAAGPIYSTATGGRTKGFGPRAVGNVRMALAGSGPLRVTRGRPWVRLSVLRPGLYEVTAADLATAGVSTAGIDPATFRIFRATPGDLPESADVDLGPDSLRECAIDVTGAGDSSFDTSDRIRFYATGATGFGYDLKLGGSSDYQEAQHSDFETLWLTWGPGPTGDPPRRIATRDASPVSPSAPVVAAVPHRVHFEANRLPDFNLYQPPLRWERWFDRLLSQGSRVPFILRPPQGVPGAANSVLIRMWGVTYSIGSVPDHVARIYWNHALVDTAGWNLTDPQDLSASGLRGETSDTLEIEIPVLVDPPYRRNDASYLAWFEVSYLRELRASNDTLQFAAPDSLPGGRLRYTVVAISDTTTAWLLDRADPESPVRLAGGAWTETAPNFTLTVEDSIGPGYRPRYSLVSTARTQKPSISVYAPVSSPRAIDDLLDPANGADYLIVAPPAFEAAAETLAAYRSGNVSGIPAARARIATTDRIFAQFGSGRPSPVAIRNSILYAVRHWAPPAPIYICLLGDATYDPKNYLGIGALDLVPTYSNYFDTSYGQFISDDFYGLMDGSGDQLLDLAVGRLPAGNAAEAMSLVTGKLRAYEDTNEFDSWRARAILCADDANHPGGDAIANGHLLDMERKDWYHMPFPVERAKVYLNDFAFADTTRQTKPAAREEFISQINRGAWLTDYIGHGNESQLADEQIFRSSDVPRLTNASRPSIFGYFSCTVGKFDEPSGEGLGELLLTTPGGGAVASLAATGLALASLSNLLNDSFVDELFPVSGRVDLPRTTGLAFARAKNQHAGVTNFTVQKYNVLGDPALLPPLPRGRGVWEKAPLDSVLRGEAATFAGHALMPDSSADTLSTGTVRVTVLGPPILRTQFAPFNNSVANYRVPGVVLYRGEVALSRGSFATRFVVPTDGRIVGSGGVLRALFSQAGGEGVGLAVDSIRIASAASSRIDGTAPTIRLVYPAGSDSTLRPGDRLTIALEDSSGIDLTRLDNAHTIFVIVDDRGTPIELTPQFNYEFGSFTRGSVDLTIPGLDAGAHLLEVHASDTFRNIAVRTFVIDIANGSATGSALVLDQVFNYPNPFPRETYLHARLNQAARLKIQILTVAGRRVREIQLDGRAGENYIPWDGRDSVGENVAIGVYLFKVTAESPSGRVSAIGRALRTE